jgi:hypothetical protein
MKSVKESFLFMVNILREKYIRGLPKPAKEAEKQNKTKTTTLLLFAPIHASSPTSKG